MARGRRLAAAIAAAALALGTLVAAGCGGDDDSAAGTSSAAAGSDLSGDIAIDGSSTVGPLTSAAAEAFNGENSGVNITVGTSGTGGGFELFCKGETDINDASSKINPEQIAACKSGGVQYVELRVASDGITMVTNNPSNVGGDGNLTTKQLEAIWAPDSKINNWKDIPPAGSFDDVPLTLAGPDSQSGTYDFFNEKVLGEDAAGETIEPRQDYSASADDNVTVRAVQSAEGGLGYFGYTYFEENQDTLTDFAVDGVKPTPETITDGTYPLSRPLFIYVKTTSLDKPEVKAFVKYYLDNALTLSKAQQFVPATQAELDASIAKIGQ
jgi:phosphate transport system substrate-binding protein